MHLKCARTLQLLAALLLAAFVFAGDLRAVEDGADKGAPAASADEQAIRKAGAAYRDALAKGDIDAIVGAWTKDADVVDQDGRAFKVHAGLERAKKAAEQGVTISRPPRKTETLSIRFITPDVALEDGVFERDASDEDDSHEGRYTAVWVKRDGRWLLDGERESPVRAEASAAPLEALGWMVGDWTAAGADMTAELTCTWGPNKTYLLRQIKFQPKDGPELSATQWVGWDPLHNHVRSFLFDSAGGYTEGNWTHDGDAWVVKSKGVRREGQRATATTLYSRVDDNTWMIETLDNEIGGQPGPEINLRVTRKGASK